MLDTSLLSVFLVGLLGGLHCAGMCGGIVGAMTLGAARRRSGAASDALAAIAVTVQATAPQGRGPSTGNWQRLIAFNAGRVLTYVLAGALVGGIGSTAWLTARLLPVQQAAFVLANLTLIALGLYLSGALRSIAILETAGRGLWRRVGPTAARSLRATHAQQAFAAGMLWGLVPCGMVYAVLVAALTSGSAAQGGLLMAAFGAGTLPNLLALGWSAGKAARWLDRRWLKLSAGALIVFFGVAGLLRLDPLAHLHGLASLCIGGLQAIVR